MKLTIEIYKDSWISKQNPWRAKVTDQDSKSFTTGMYRTKKSLKECFNQHECTFLRRKDLDCS